MACLDTSFLIDLLAKDAAARTVAADLDDEGDRHGVSPVSAAELWIGAHFGSREEYHRTEELLESLLWLEFNRSTARRVGDLQATLLDEGSELGFNDCVIAATALEHDVKLVTADSDFERVQGLRVLTY